jgi:hypothetical protein
MSDQDQRLGEMLRAAAARAEREAPGFDPDRIVAEAHRRRPRLGLLAALRASRVTSAPAVAFATVVVLVLVAVAVLAASHVFSGGGSQHAGGTTTPATLPVTSTLPPTTTTPPPTTTTRPAGTTTVPPTSTSLATSTTTATTTTTTVPPTTTTAGAFFYTAQWRGATVNLRRVADIAHIVAAGGTLVGQVTGFLTDDPSYLGLDGASIDVWRLPSRPGELVVDNSRQPQSPKGTWTFPG